MQKAVREHARLELVPYTRDILDLSHGWLSDVETKRLTLTPSFTREEQQAFFAGLPSRQGYHIWGVRLNGGAVIGAAGIKNVRGTTGEYWGYIGDKLFWGQGLGRDIIRAVEEEAHRIGLDSLHLTVSPDNIRAVSLYRRAGFVDIGKTDGLLRMAKSIAI
jgi:RimJ/RimL family protein N-acetyltransferase